ncbi:protein ENHANCED DOWNY MILDEW 2-like isoform X1 [Asparagus officinalis]|uniref:protein ENHANCED DOWNY MILDEW 2-like isoform X1 n=1 Tax=Asparagus officinalis TaxID=4686 RepID=UPI00098E5B3B|nr:protein ENHANCED DOWNY MILDEW 2-like isoform X1 [Asparagus officinalis]
MSSSVNDDERLPKLVTDYYFVDDKGIPISFTALPFYLEETEKSNATKTRIFVRGLADGGLQKVYEQVTSWGLRLEEDQPEVLVLLRGNKWSKLQEPRKSYRGIIGSILITINWLHCLKRKPEGSRKELWDHLHKVFSSLEKKPTEDDLTQHVSVIKTIAERDKTVAKAELLVMFLKQELGEKTSFHGVSERGSVAEKPLIAYDNAVDEGATGDGLMEEPGLFDSVCAICDNGGEVLCCEGRCLRSFHPTKDAGADTNCESLGYTMAQVEALPNFLCKNCRYKQHQCFACGKLGSSDKTAGAEVFPCASATCGHFYHPKCVAKLLFPASELESTKFQKKVEDGESFTCPIHKCAVCNKRENKEIHDLQFAICRRCPTSYHRKCLPRKIVFEDSGLGVLQRAWDDLLEERILIYCMKHKIDNFLKTPIRTHIIFPANPEKRNKIKIVMKKRKIYDEFSMQPPSVKSHKLNGKHSNIDKSCSVGSGRADTKKMKSTSSYCLKASMNGKNKDSMCSSSMDPIEKKFYSSFPVADIETVQRLKTLMDDVSSSLTLEDVRKKHTVPSTYAHSARHTIKGVTLGKVEGSVEAIRTAIQKLEAGGSIDEAKMICEPKILNQILRWRKNFKVYLAPFLHGMRYTSFGRHFTKLDKLKEIVDKLQWYVQSGDVIVDFCCGANDFSKLMKEKLDATGKRCLFKNYDIIQPKNDFNFEKRDWMTVDPKELADGSRLIMGLNPPFGVNAALANKFIDKALTFRPKLLILIVPEETERLHRKNPPYDLIWEDREKLSGKSFYLPGSIDTEEKQMDTWNMKSPPLYLWSRRDWTGKHKGIALEMGHISGTQEFASCHDHPPIEPTFYDRDKEASPRAVELRTSVECRELIEERLDVLKEGEIGESSDMDISPANRSAYESSFEVVPNFEVFTDERSYAYTSREGFAPGPLPPYSHQGSGGWIEDYTSPKGFAPGPLPPYSHQGSGGWIED